MSWEYDEDAYKEYTRETWNQSADAYEAWVRILEPYDEPLIGDMLEPGQRVLDLATGPGRMALRMASSVGPDGSVLGVDLSDRMIDRARRAAKDDDASNVRFEVMDAEKLRLEEDAFDLVTCRFSLQILTDPAAALEEAARVLKPGGRFAASVWASPGERSPALHAIVGPMLRLCTPAEDGYLPTPYELGGPRTLSTMVQDAGLDPVAQERVRVPLGFQDPEEYLEAILEGTPLGHSLREENQRVQDGVIEETRQNLDRWNTDPEGLVLDSEAVILHATKPP